MQKAVRIITIVLLVLLLAVFVWWAVGGIGTLWGGAAALLTVTLFALCVVNLVPQTALFFTSPEVPPVELGDRSNRCLSRHPWLKIAAVVLALRAATYILAYIFYTNANGYSGGMLNVMRDIWVRSDANSYLGIAEHWYVTEGDPRFHIVFFPLYPMITRAFMFLTGDSFSAALTVSAVCSVGAGIFLYELAALTLERRQAMRTVWFMFLLPASFFLGAPMTESLFLMLSVAAMYFAQKRRILPACILAGLCAFTRSVGVFMAVPIAFECISAICEKKRANNPVIKDAILSALCLLIVPLGLAGYIYINYAVTGDPFKFMEYQRDHWSQGFGLFFSTADYQADYLINYIRSGDWRMAFGLFLPNLLASLGALSIAGAAGKRLRASYMAYFLCYFVFSIGATWLLSAPRYLAAAFPMAFALTHITDRRTAWVAAIGLAALLTGYLAMFVSGYPIY